MDPRLIQQGLVALLFTLTPVSAVAQAGFCDMNWNVRWFRCDYGHDNDFALERDGTPVCGSSNCPGAPGSCWSAPITTNRFLVSGEVSGQTGGLGAFEVGQDRDVQVYGDTYLYVAAPRTISVPLSSDVGRFWLNNSEVTPNASPATVVLDLQFGWNHLEWTSYNQHVGSSIEMDFPFAHADRTSLLSSTGSQCFAVEKILSGNDGRLFCGDTTIGTIATTGPTAENSYTFEGTAGNKVSINAASVAGGGNFLPCWQLSAPNENLVGSEQCIGPAVRDLSQTGTYRVMVRDNNNFETGSYSLSVQGISEAFHCGRPIACGEENVIGDLDAAGDSDSLSFFAQSGDAVSITAAKVAGGGLFLPCWQLYAPNGASVGSQQCSGPAARKNLSQTGTYTVVVHENNDLETGSYSLSVQGISEAFHCGRPIACGEENVIGDLDPAGDSDSLSFFAQNGDAVSITAAKVAGGGLFLPCWQLYAPNGASVGSQQCSGPAARNLSQTGTYTVVVHENNDLETGSYSLSLTGSCPPRACSDGVDNDGDGAIDFPTDTGCRSAQDASEVPDCSDSLDNDADGLADSPSDLGCSSASAGREDPQCQDGISNDADGLIDFDGGTSAGVPSASQTASDPQCVGKPWRNCEKQQCGCGLGFELVLLLPPLMWLFGRRSRGWRSRLRCFPTPAPYHSASRMLGGSP